MTMATTHTIDSNYSENDFLFQATSTLRSKQKHPILLIPGAFTGAWLWKDNFMKDFSEVGFDCYAMSFRGHDKSRFRHLLNGLEEHVEDLTNAINSIPGNPILVGYSLGGLVLSKYLENNAAPGAVMLCAVPSHGVLGSFFDLAASRPISALKLASLAILPTVRHFGQPPEGIYSQNIDDVTAKRITKQLKAEPLKALIQSALIQNTIPKISDTPIKLYGATGDHIIPAKEVIKAAQSLGAPYRIFDGLSHTIMVEPESHLVVSEILTWLEEHKLYDSNH